MNEDMFIYFILLYFENTDRMVRAIWFRLTHRPNRHRCHQIVSMERERPKVFGGRSRSNDHASSELLSKL